MFNYPRDTPFEMITYKLKALFGNTTTLIGEPNVYIRKCRFCGKGISDGVKFNHIAHAISQSLGNTFLFALDECDDCNQNFSNLEQHLGNFLSLMLYTYDIEGKPSRKNPRGLRKIETPDYKFSTEGDMKVVTVKNRLQQSVFDEIKDSGLFSFNSSLKFDKYIPLNVYKTFCKFAINLINSEDIYSFSKLIKWIRGNEVMTFKPAVLFAPCSMKEEQPKFMYFTQSTSSAEPFCVGCFLICNLAFLMEIPSDEIFERGDSRTPTNALKALSKALFPNLNFQEIDLSETNHVAMQLKFEISIPSTLNEGSDYFVASSEDEVKKLMDRFGISRGKFADTK